MANNLILASAGAGKSERISREALERASDGENVLIITYTENNQRELFKKICQLNGFKPQSITIKGWFKFLLEDMVRPYQQFIFPDRISGIYFNKHGHPHKQHGRNIPGTGEKIDHHYNPRHYLTGIQGKAHTSFLSKLATRILKESRHRSLIRLASIYDAVYIDEVQDLVGWDFNIIEALARAESVDFTCVGDFRQTVYSTHPTTKKPKSRAEKLIKFESIGFTPNYLNYSWRCVQPICDFAHLIHAEVSDYPETNSNVSIEPETMDNHIGVFTVSEEHVLEYMEKYNPVLLRRNKNERPDICEGKQCYNFRASKGLGFERVLILPTQNQMKFLKGEDGVFENSKTDAPRNIFYVISTRARFSVAFLHSTECNIPQVLCWTP